MLKKNKPDKFRLKEWVARFNLQVQKYSFSVIIQRITSSLKTENRVKTENITQDKIEAQFRRVRTSFMERPKTMMEVEVQTGVMRTNITRYVATMRRRLQIQIHHYGICPVTRASGVQFLTTDPTLFVVHNVPSLFD